MFEDHAAEEDVSKLRLPLLSGFILVLVAGLPSPAPANGVVVSEFRFLGPAGGNGEFVELVNASSAGVDTSGYELRGCGNLVS